jgi:hypothetical protein
LSEAIVDVESEGADHRWMRSGFSSAQAGHLSAQESERGRALRKAMGVRSSPVGRGGVVMRLLVSLGTSAVLAPLAFGCGLTESLDGYGGGIHGPADVGVDQGQAGTGADAGTVETGGAGAEAGDASGAVDDTSVEADACDDVLEDGDAPNDAAQDADACDDVLEDGDAPNDAAQDAEGGVDAPPNDASACTGEQKLCGGGCVDIGNPAFGCQPTGCWPCSAPPHMSATCVGPSCAPGTCLGTWRNCDGNPTNGCEIDTASDPDNCGACEAACSTAHVPTPTCTEGACTGACQSGWGDCNIDKRTDGCEVAVANDTENCGACGRTCSTSNTMNSGGVCKPGPGSLSCNAGLCDTSRCCAGWSNVNMPRAPTPDDGCEHPN